MGNEIQLGIRLTGDSKGLVGSVQGARSEFRDLGTDATKAGSAVAGSFAAANQGARSLSDTLEQAKLAAAGYLSVSAAMDASRWAIEQASAIRSVEARLKAATDSASEFRAAQGGVYEMANRYGQALNDTSGTFARLNPAIEQLGGNTAVTLRMMDGLAAAARITGATSAESGALMLQFSQAMGSGVVQGDEFRSMMETAQPLMREVAATLGKTTGQLRQMSSEGKLTSEVFGNAVLAAVDKLKAKAEGIPATFDQVQQAVRNSMSRVAESFMTGLQGDAGAGPNRIADALTAAVPQAQALGATLRSLTGTVETLTVGYVAFRAASMLGPMIDSTARAAVAQGQLMLAVQQGRAVAVQSAEATRLRAAADLEAARADEALAAAELAHLQVVRDSLLAERALDQVRLTASNRTLVAATAAGSLSYAYKMGDEAARAKTASLLALGEVSRGQAVVERDLAAASAASTAASAAAARAALGYEAAAAAATLGARAKTAAVNLASGALAAMGGPVGATILGLTALAWWLHSSSDAASGLETALDKARAARDRLAKEKQFGTGEAAAQREAIAALEAQIVKEQAIVGNHDYGRPARDAAVERIAAYRKEIEQTQAALKEFEQRAAPAAAPAAVLSDASSFDVFAKQYKTREQLLREHKENLVKIETSGMAKMNAAKTDAERATAEADYLAVRKAMLAAQAAELKALPDEKAADTLLKGHVDAYLRILDERQKVANDIARRSFDNGDTSFADYADTRRSKNAAFTNERVDTVSRLLPRADVQEKAQIQLQIEKIRESSQVLDDELAKQEDEFNQRRDEMLRSIGSEGAGANGSALEKAGADFGKKFQLAARQAVVAGDDKGDAITDALSQAWTRLTGRAQFDDVKKRFEELQAQLAQGVEQLRSEADGRGLDTWLAADKAEADLRQKLLPALQDTQAQMRELAGESPDLQKAASDAALALDKALAESRKLAERGDWTVGISRGVETYGKQAMDIAGQVEQAWGRATSNMEDGLVNFAMTGKLNFNNLASSIMADILRIQIRAAATPLLSSLGSAISGYFSGGSAASPSTPAPTVDSSLSTLTVAAKGRAYDGAGEIHAFARGGVVDRPTYFKFASGGSFSNGLMGEAGAEAIMPLTRGADGRLGVTVSGGGSGGGAAAPNSIRIEIHNEGTTDQQVTSAKPRFDPEGLVVDIFTRDLSRNGPMAQALTAFGGRK